MKLTKRGFLVAVLLLATVACGDVSQANGGGRITIDLEPGMKLVNVQTSYGGDMFTGQQLYYTVRPMREGEMPETYTFRQHRGHGAIVIREHAR